MGNSAMNAILISPLDDVATVTTELHPGDVAVFLKNSELIRVPIIETIPRFHKVAIRIVVKQEAVRKYGEIIGQATQDISPGSHVHDHNVASPI
ncbi:MAG: hydrolase [Firmicutes bacterium]|nr:hydrolase [Bacillota bacterium]